MKKATMTIEQKMMGCSWRCCTMIQKEAISVGSPA